MRKYFNKLYSRSLEPLKIHKFILRRTYKKRRKSRTNLSLKPTTRLAIHDVKQFYQQQTLGNFRILERRKDFTIIIN